ncbi:MAG TPA: hypothetical protein VE987_22890, partial [Polyangiaceae bacterium]|nr:hypothetical protein [Polyangiaceae bacterium]
MRTSTKIVIAVPVLLLAGIPVASCVSTTSGLGTATKGCAEFQPGATIDANLAVDAHVRAFMQASADLGGVAVAVKSAVLSACDGIARDLGANDTWTALGDADDAISNRGGTGACDAAGARVAAIMSANANANFALVVSRGACRVDFDAEARCESACSAQTKCDPGKVEDRCDPAQLSVSCHGKCAANAFCEGRPDRPTSCEGQCEAECTGHCSGTCTDEQGRRTSDDPNCHGKCADHCSGQCTGRCKIDAADGVECGGSVTCKGGCTADFDSPACEAECKPPPCMIDESCFEGCRANAVAKAVCEPTTVKLLADASAAGDVLKLVATIDKNLPPLVDAAEAQAHAAADIVQNVSASGQAIINGSGNLDGKSIACAGA